ncbi:hypothetical protein SAMN05421788_107129 [Filimonas lacunae]|uniref:Uncharacterized protein n=1 Tax=Filimonas lacunae TaxID=477680 RepID=A0A1N7QW20_9BACT|nr:hypothetical protein [Filimonas lacunae]SIT27070.1 hypothetical protein SAMN05421788_107129 [Filimonas lacunae]
MSWDIVLFNSRQTILSVEEIDEEQLEPTDFYAVLESSFEQIEKDNSHRRINGDDFIIEYFTHNEPVSNTILFMYNEKGLYELITIARKHHWQIFDTSLGQMIDLNNPAINGYEDFKSYLQHVLWSNK